MFVKGSISKILVYLITFFVTAVVSNTNENTDGLPFCGESKYDRPPTNILIVSTLDGQLTALEGADGAKKWSIFTGAPLLSSNIHHLELTSEGQWARLVPSLSGALYKLAGDSLQPLPLTADHLLSSSYKYSDDLVIAGGRETASFGVDAASGRILWQCEMRGCAENEATAGNGGIDKENSELLLLRRTAHTVRALETKTGQERWNFSVGEHDVSLSSDANGCLNGDSDNSEASNVSSATPLLKIILPEGLVQAHNPFAPEIVLWKQKLESPIAGAWRLKQGKIEAVDVVKAGFGLFNSKDPGPKQNVNEPSVYIGVHNNQLYIQESANYQEVVRTAVFDPSASSNQKKLSWHSSSPIETKKEDSPDTALAKVENNKIEEMPSKALQLLYQEKSKGSAGFFLYEINDDDDLCNKESHEHKDYEGDNSTEEYTGHNMSDDSQEQPQVHILVVSLWFWWKEVLVIAVSSALLLNLVVTQRVLFRPAVVTPEIIKQEYIVVERHVEVPAPSTPNAITHSDSFSTNSSSSGSFCSRYLNDFSPLRCLGRGGFGVVFEVKNNIDDCSYAVKRITLPDRKSQRDRVLREVRALAKLEHPHIVRYFNAWLEQPPCGWQEEKDKHTFKEFNITSQPLNSLFTSNTNTSIQPERWKPEITAPPKSPPQHPNILNLRKESHEISMDNCFDALAYNYKEKSTRCRSYSLNDSFSIVFDDEENATDNSEVKLSKGDVSNGVCSNNSKEDDSFIVFADSKGAACAGDSIISISETEKESHQFKKKRGHRRHWSLDMSTAPSVKSSSRIYLYIQMQLCQTESLHEWLRQNPAIHIRKSQVACFFKQIVSAVEYVHLAGLIHRDLKPSNILFAPDGSIKVGDFGLVTEMSGQTPTTPHSPPGDGQQLQLDWKHTHRVGTHLYMSPEQATGASYSFKVDIFSLGLILFELLFPFSTESERISALLQLRNGIFPTTFIKEYPMEHELLQVMLSHEPDCRPTAEGVRERSWNLFEFEPISVQSSEPNS